MAISSSGSYHEDHATLLIYSEAYIILFLVSK